MNKSWIVLVCDPESGKWSVAVNMQVNDENPDEAEEQAREFYDEMRMSGDHETPAIVLFTGDFVQF
jgi:hypothetical protein